jgi:uncharacterized cupin superfamily protein
VRELPRGAVVAFLRGTDGAHRVRNTSSSQARYLVVSTMRYPEVAEYPDTGAVLVLGAPGDRRAFAQGCAADWASVVAEALRAESG